MGPEEPSARGRDESRSPGGRNGSTAEPARDDLTSQEHQVGGVVPEVASPQPTRLLNESEEPFEPGALHPGRGLPLRPGQEIERSADAEKRHTRKPRRNLGSSRVPAWACRGRPKRPRLRCPECDRGPPLLHRRSALETVETRCPRWLLEEPARRSPSPTTRGSRVSNRRGSGANPSSRMPPSCEPSTLDRRPAPGRDRPSSGCPRRAEPRRGWQCRRCPERSGGWGPCGRTSRNEHCRPPPSTPDPNGASTASPIPRRTRSSKSACQPPES